jgi:hypothetical protein
MVDRLPFIWRKPALEAVSVSETSQRRKIAADYAQAAVRLQGRRRVG